MINHASTLMERLVPGSRQETKIDPKLGHTAYCVTSTGNFRFISVRFEMASNLWICYISKPGWAWDFEGPDLSKVFKSATKAYNKQFNGWYPIKKKNTNSNEAMMVTMKAPKSYSYYAPESSKKGPRIDSVIKSLSTLPQ